MRKHQQRQILELLQTLEEAQGAGLYADCQEVALQIGEFIESLAEEGTKTVVLLEEYCELLYNVNIGKQNAKALKKHLYKIENSIKSELKPDKIEIAFLSYKASMSDSIESVYLAAKNDPNCDAYWIPIPYYERNSDGSFGTMRYEEAEFYDNLDCTNWQTYDIEARHPEIIFTFAPYDAGNYVTSVHPDFYCERLRGLTDLLVYTPYFVAVDGVAEQFVTVAGCVFAHKVILQSEKVRDFYVSVFKEQYGNQFGKPEEKFVALGSPKFDAVLSTKREIISDKKVVLYNTTVGAILQDSAQYLLKLRSVLEVFRNHNDVTLWWRPHPLSESTFESMRPELASEYRAIIADYKASGYGILDEAPEGLHRAIALSDAYYGDWSSLVALYGVTGKPIMIQDANFLLGNEHRDALLFEASYDEGDYIWFAAYWFNELFKCNKQTWVAEYLGSFPGEKRNGVRLFSWVAKNSGKLYFAPLAAKNIAVYDMVAAEFSSIELDETSTIDPNMYGEFAHCVSLGSSVYFIPGAYPAIVRIDTDTNAIQYITDWLPKLAAIKDNHPWYFYAYTIANNKLYITCCCANAVLIIDNSGITSELFTIGRNDISYNGICYDGQNFWLAPCQTIDGVVKLVKWDGRSREVEYIEIISASESAVYIGKISLVLRLLYHSGTIYIIPNFLNRALQINVASNTIKVTGAFQHECESTGVTYLFDKFNAIWQYDNTIYTLGARTQKLTIFYPATDTYNAASIRGDTTLALSNVFKRSVAGIEQFDDCINVENNIFNLDEYINLHVNALTDDLRDLQSQLAIDKYMSGTQNAGQRILQTMLKFIS